MTTFPRPRLLPVQEDRPVVRSLLRGDRASEAAAPAAFSRSTLVAVYPELAARVHRFLCDLLGDPALASDATQETFVRALRKVDAVPACTPVVPWVFGVARRVSLEMRRARGRGRRVMVDVEPSHDHVVDRKARSPEAALLDREALVIVTEALERLPEDRRAALLLRLDHGLAYDEIAQAMGWSVAKTKVEIFRGREVLRGTFEAWRGGDP